MHQLQYQLKQHIRLTLTPALSHREREKSASPLSLGERVRERGN
jgi:hypothetical protein